MSICCNVLGVLIVFGFVCWLPATILSRPKCRALAPVATSLQWALTRYIIEQVAWTHWLLHLIVLEALSKLLGPIGFFMIVLFYVFVVKANTLMIRTEEPGSLKR